MYVVHYGARRSRRLFKSFPQAIKFARALSAFYTIYGDNHTGDTMPSVSPYKSFKLIYAYEISRGHKYIPIRS